MAAGFKEDELPFVNRAQSYCAMSEQCVTSVRAKLISWGVERKLIERIITHLVDKGYVNEQRYVMMYCDSKLRLQKWGKVKIGFQLRSKQIPKALIDEGLASIDEEVYRQVLADLALAKWETMKEGDFAKNRQKLVAHLQTKGFSVDEILDVVNEIIKEQE